MPLAIVVGSGAHSLEPMTRDLHDSPKTQRAGLWMIIRDAREMEVDCYQWRCKLERRRWRATITYICSIKLMVELDCHKACECLCEDEDDNGHSLARSSGIMVSMLVKSGQQISASESVCSKGSQACEWVEARPAGRKKGSREA